MELDRLTKSAYFIPIKSSYSAEDYARIYIYKIVSLHGVPIFIILDRGAQFLYRFWRSFQKGLGNQVKLRTAILPKADCQAERTIQNLDNMLRACIIYFNGNWD